MEIAEHNISGANECVVTSTVGRPFVLDTCVSQSFSIFEPLYASVLVIYGSICVPNVFQTPVTYVSLSHSSFDRDMPTQIMKKTTVGCSMVRRS